MSNIAGIGSIEEFLDLMADTVTVYPFSAFTSGSGASFSATGTVYKCHINMKNHIVVSHDGREILARGRIVLGSAAVIGVKDRIVLPSEYIPTDPPILAVNVATDEGGNHHTTIEIG